jgi:phenylalanyl-tRNA synthetase alpha chain
MLSDLPTAITDKLSMNLHNRPGHPICLIKERIYKYFDTVQPFTKHDTLDKIVPIYDNFDSLLIPTDHPSRSKSDTYYVDEGHVLRTHTTCHQNVLLSRGQRQFLITGDVYRKDEIDRFHFPVFHQMEGLSVVEQDAETSLKTTLVGLVAYLFPDKPYRINNDYFPFTDPSFEIEVLLNDRWVEILGCGLVRPEILARHGISCAWAFGLGLERLAMILYDIPDIRYFWTADERFLNQFRDRSCTDEIKFVPYPVLPSITKDISFWIPEPWAPNDFFEVVRNLFGHDIQSVELLDTFYHPKRNQRSETYRLTLTCNSDLNLQNPSVFNTLCNSLLLKLREELVAVLKLELR